MSFHLHRQINKLKKNILALGALVEENLHEALISVQQRDYDLAKQVIRKDKQIDLAEIDIEEDCLLTLALYQPVAHDLRFVVMILKINHDLERIGDLAKNMAEQSIFLASQGELEKIPFDLGAMGQKTKWMVRTALDSLVNLDVQAAQDVRKVDDEIDQIHRGMYSTVTAAIRQNPDQCDQLIHMLNVSRQLERIADHACNIAKDVLYMIGGEIVRHAETRREMQHRDLDADGEKA